MCVALLGWVLWNQKRYGGPRNRRTVHPRHLSENEVSRAMALPPASVGALRRSPTIALHFDEVGHPVIEQVSLPPGAPRTKGKKRVGGHD
jgi:poly-beta-1,6-N-acetyl-D-glucosamine biosynthesis protein PgaD